MKSSVTELTVCPAFVMLLKCIGLTTTQVEAEAEVYSGPVKNIENKALPSNRETWCDGNGVRIIVFALPSKLCVDSVVVWGSGHVNATTHHPLLMELSDRVRQSVLQAKKKQKTQTVAGTQGSRYARQPVF